VTQKTESRYKRMAAECYELVMLTGRFDVEDVKDQLRERILEEGVHDGIVDDFVDGLVVAEDKRRTATADSHQLDLFSGEPAALDAVWALGHGERVLARNATRPDVYARLGLKAENAARVSAAFAREQERMSRLLPFMTDDTITVPEALAMWHRNNVA
jgi:hypothetical protein